MMTVWTGLENGVPTAAANPAELAPVRQDTLCWPRWGQFVQTKGKSGEAVAAENKKPAAPLFVAKRRVVKTGYSEGDRIEIRDGLADGERVITIGRNAVRDGTEVQVLDPVAVVAKAPEKAK